MTKRTILSVGGEFPGQAVEYARLDSRRTLLDADIVVFWPGLDSFYSHDKYQDKPLLTEHSSFAFKEAVAHWRGELRLVLEAGKTVFVYLTEPKQIFVCSGEKRYSGTGRGRVTTNLVTPASTYDFLPFDIRVQARRGSTIRPAGDLRYLGAYWSDFGPSSTYEATIESAVTDILLKTRIGDQVVGAALRTAEGGGCALLLPVFSLATVPDSGQADWKHDSNIFGSRLVTALVGIEKALLADSNVLPAPSWIEETAFSLPGEAEIRSEILKVSTKVEKLMQTRADLESKLRNKGSLRLLLYGKGRALEGAIQEALELMGFEASGFRESGSEFDVVFSSSPW